MNVKPVIAITFLLALIVIIVILFSIYVSNGITRIAIITVAIILFMILGLLIVYNAGSVKNIRKISISSASSPARIPTDLPVTKDRNPLERCHMNIGHAALTSLNDASLNMFIIFISRMHKLMKLILASFEVIAEKLCNGRININDSLKYLNELLVLADKAPVLYTRSYRNVFKLLKLTEPAKTEGPLSDRVYALDEIGFNLVLLAAASAILPSAKETYNSIYETLSNVLYRYEFPLVDIRTYYLRSFFKYFEKFRISEVFASLQSNFHFIEAIHYSLVSSLDSSLGSSLDSNLVKFKSITGKVGSLSEIIALPEKRKPMYVIITFYPEYPEGGARGIDSFKLQGYKINTIIFKEGYEFPYFTLLTIIDNKTLCLITSLGIKGLFPEPLFYEKQETLLNTIKKIENDHIRIRLLSYNIITVLYELESDTSSLSKEIRPIAHINVRDINSNMRRKKEEFRDSVMKEFIVKYSELERKLKHDIRLRDTTIFKVLEFIGLSTGDISSKSYNSVITEYLFKKGEPRNTRISIAPFIEKVVYNFFQIKFELTISKKDTQEIWNDIAEETDLYANHPPMDVKGSLRDAIENTMTLFTITLHNVFPFKELQERVHCDFILATIYLIKRLWKVYDRCIAVIKLLLEKDTTPDEQKKLLHYLLLKFNKLIYVKCYFASFSNNLANNQKLESKRLELRRNLEAYEFEVSEGTSYA